MRMWSNQTMQNKGTIKILRLAEVCLKSVSALQISLQTPSMPVYQPPVEKLKRLHQPNSVSGQLVISESARNSSWSKTKVQNDIGLINIGAGMIPLHLSTSETVSLCHASLKLFLRLFTSGHVTSQVSFYRMELRKTSHRTSHKN